MQEAAGFALDSSKFRVTGMRMNMTALTGLYTPFFEAVYYGSKPNLGPNPVLIASLVQWATTVAIITWAIAITLGLDWATAKPDSSDL